MIAPSLKIIYQLFNGLIKENGLFSLLSIPDFQGMITTWNIILPFRKKENNQDNINMGNQSENHSQRKCPACFLKADQVSKCQQKAQSPHFGYKGMSTGFFSKFPDAYHITHRFHYEDQQNSFPFANNHLRIQKIGSKSQ